jgi:hypothetical protein
VTVAEPELPETDVIGATIERNTGETKLSLARSVSLPAAFVG